MKNLSLSVVLALFLITLNAKANSRFDGVKIRSQQLTKSTYMFTGAGGNIGVSAGEDGILIIDDQFAPLADKIEKETGEN